MKWNYRVFKDEDGEFGVRKVFYKDNGTMWGCTVDTEKPCGKTLEGFTQGLSSFQKALTLPILGVADFPEDFQRTQYLQDLKFSTPKPSCNQFKLRSDAGTQYPDRPPAEP